MQKSGCMIIQMSTQHQPSTGTRAIFVVIQIMPKWACLCASDAILVEGMLRLMIVSVTSVVVIKETTKKYDMKYCTWLSASDCDPPHGLDLSHGSRDSKKVEGLVKDFLNAAHFDVNYPALVGYPLDGRIQLLSGTHRHEAARRTGYKLPVSIFLRSYVEGYWGTGTWADLIADIPVKDLDKLFEGFSDVPPGLDERYQPK